jgi:hypothetical protein
MGRKPHANGSKPINQNEIGIFYSMGRDSEKHTLMGYRID